MKNHLYLNLHRFLSFNAIKSKKVLIACSTGVDSMVLTDLMLRVKDQFQLELALVHVDHGWRAQSEYEYLFCETFCHQHKIVFYGYKLQLDKSVKDPENKARMARYQAFKKAYGEFGADYIVLAHHRDDLEETVFKRLYEGAQLLNLFGMKEKSYKEGMCLIRPLLAVTKQELKEWAHKHNLTFYEDETNQDSSFLRTRIRSELFPALEKIFLKKKGQFLSHLSRESQELESYFWDVFKESVWLSDPSLALKIIYFEGMHSIAIKNCLILFFKLINFSAPKMILDGLVEAVKLSQNPREFQTGHFKLKASRGFVLVIDQSRASCAVTPFEGTHLVSIPPWLSKEIGVGSVKMKIFLNRYSAFINNSNYK